MSKDVAVVSDSGVVLAVNVHLDDYELAANEVLVTNPAYVGGDYVDGLFYSPQPFASWTRAYGEWVPPIPRPSEGSWVWNEELQDWSESVG
jgi:hypothetical protein